MVTINKFAKVFILQMISDNILNNFFKILVRYEQNNENQRLEDFSVAYKLYDEVKILCLVLTQPANYEKKAIHVKNTWGRRCNKLLFMSTDIGWLLQITMVSIKCLNIRFQMIT